MLWRLSSNQPYITDIKDYQGIVLIDEVELHLHPKWKYDFVKHIRELFPKIQFIFTTHSPTVILGASSEAVFYKVYKDNAIVSISKQIPNKGYSNNTLISSPLFDLDSMTSRNFDIKKLSEDDYIYSQIHDVVSKQIKNDLNIDEDEIMKIIEKELDSYDKS
jgi:predicted ATP-binding protein involved in virulence